LGDFGIGWLSRTNEETFDLGSDLIADRNIALTDPRYTQSVIIEDKSAMARPLKNQFHRLLI
jgi:hypothetical protein